MNDLIKGLQAAGLNPIVIDENTDFSKLPTLNAAPLHEYAFDVKLFAAIRIKAASEAEARATLKDCCDGMECNGGTWPSGLPILFEASFDDGENSNLYEIDGEPVP